MIKIVKKYKGFLIMLIVSILLILINRDIGLKAMHISGSNFLEMLQVLPPIFILLGLFDVWVPREVLVKLMGEKSGIVGILIAFFMGSFTAGPLYAAFPVAVILIKKGSKFSNVLIFLGAWSTTKIPMLLFEMTSLGWKFALTRLITDIVGILIMSYFIEFLVGEKERASIYNTVSLMEQ